MSIASGTWGTISWELSDAGELTIGGGIQPYNMLNNYPWDDYRDRIVSVSFTGDIASRYNILRVDDGTLPKWYSAFKDCANLETVSGVSHLKNVYEMGTMFLGCSSLSSIDLSQLDTAKLSGVFMLFHKCNILTTVNFGSSGFPNLKIGGIDARPYLISGSFKTAEKDGTVVASDDEFLSLTPEEQAGAWTRKTAKSTVTCTASRSQGGSDEEDGSDVSFKFTYVIQDATATVVGYKKLVSESSYPSTPEFTTALQGPSGKTTYTLSDVGDEAYDFRIEVTDAGKTYVMFPEGSANIRLADFDKDGSMKVYGSLNVNDKFVLDDAREVLALHTVNGRASNGFRVYDDEYGRSVSLMIGEGQVNRGVWDSKLNRWMIYANDSTIRVNNVEIADSGWLSLPIASGWTAYSSAWTPRYRKKNGMVEVRGGVKPTSATTLGESVAVFGNLPSGYRPEYEFTTLCQGSDRKIWLLHIYADGRMSAERYRDMASSSYQSASTSEWMIFHATFFAD